MTCRICYDDEKQHDKLIEPCDCKGSVSKIHVSCFLKWMRSKKDELRCELCKKQFVDDPSPPRTTIMRSYVDWNRAADDLLNLCVNVAAVVMVLARMILNMCTGKRIAAESA